MQRKRTRVGPQSTHHNCELWYLLRAPACFLQNNGLLGHVQSPKQPPKVDTIPGRELPNPLHVNRGETANDSGVDDDDDFFKTDINNTHSFVKVIMSSNKQGEGILHTHCLPNGSITYTSHQSYQVAPRKVTLHRGSVRARQPH